MNVSHAVIAENQAYLLYPIVRIALKSTVKFVQRVIKPRRRPNVTISLMWNFQNSLIYPNIAIHANTNKECLKQNLPAKNVRSFRAVNAKLPTYLKDGTKTTTCYQLAKNCFVNRVKRVTRKYQQPVSAKTVKSQSFSVLSVRINIKRWKWREIIT